MFHFKLLEKISFPLHNFMLFVEDYGDKYTLMQRLISMNVSTYRRPYICACLVFECICAFVHRLQRKKTSSHSSPCQPFMQLTVDLFVL